jgi:hypothetical protein
MRHELVVLAHSVSCPLAAAGLPALEDRLGVGSQWPMATMSANPTT